MKLRSYHIVGPVSYLVFLDGFRRLAAGPGGGCAGGIIYIGLGFVPLGRSVGGLSTTARARSYAGDAQVRAQLGNGSGCGGRGRFRG